MSRVVGYLPQFADATESRLTVRQLVLERVGVAAANRDVERWASALEAGELARSNHMPQRSNDGWRSEARMSMGGFRLPSASWGLIRRSQRGA
jgi:hypothetical protein